MAAGIVVLILFLCVPAMAARPKYVFYFICDGLGAAQRQLSEFFLREKQKDHTRSLVMNTFEVAGMNTTYCADSLITDSAAAAIALACGKKTNKGVIAQDANGKNLTTLVEAARDHGMKTGLITTTRLTHATPAAFAAHNISRGNENQIAEDMAASGVDFMVGGGARHFMPQSVEIKQKDARGKRLKSKRTDEKNLVKAMKNKGYATFIGRQGAREFKQTDFSKKDKVFAAFTTSHTPYEIERINRYHEMPSLAAMTQAGIEVLSKGDKGFFLMVEGGRIDHAAHANDPTGVIYDTLALDHAVTAAFEFLKTHKTQTLILVVGDHETGGLGLGMDSMGYRLSMDALMATTVSVGDSLAHGEGRYTGDKKAFMDYLENKFGLADLKIKEIAALEKAMALADRSRTSGYYKINPPALMAARLLSARAHISWATTIHTATMIPMSAAGAEAQKFGGYKDNTKIAATLAALLGFSL
ncbi:MAG: alkaline phosphatase [Desulfobacter sp.]|nr:MAG: alkaline phosphatase [Desulfobacter sp.]